MSGLNLEPIRDVYNTHSRHLASLECCVAHDVASWVPQLLAQIERERAAVTEALATVREQAAEIERLRGRLADVAELRDHQIRRADTLDADVLRIQGLLAAARAERDEARAALADALQVIADLRGETP